MEFNLSIPLDEEGFIEMECDFCKNRFMLHENVYTDESTLHFFCPICGLPNQINTFYCQEVLEAAEQKALSYAYAEIERQLGPTIREINKSGLIKMSMKVPSKAPEKELYQPLNSYVLIHQKCCAVDIKILELDSEIGIYCPICGGAYL